MSSAIDSLCPSLAPGMSSGQCSKEIITIPGITWCKKCLKGEEDKDFGNDGTLHVSAVQAGHYISNEHRSWLINAAAAAYNGSATGTNCQRNWVVFETFGGYDKGISFDAILCTIPNVIGPQIVQMSGLEGKMEFGVEFKSEEEDDEFDCDGALSTLLDVIAFAVPELGAAVRFGQKAIEISCTASQLAASISEAAATTS
jgi:hypothetical protein